MPMLINYYKSVHLSVSSKPERIVIDGLTGFNIAPEERMALKQVAHYFETNQVKDAATVNTAAFALMHKTLPVNELLSSKKLNDIADQYLDTVNNKSPQNPWEIENKSIYRKVEKLQHDYDVIMDIAQILVQVQHAYLLSNHWMDLKKLTYSQIHRRIPNCSESTITRRVKSLRFHIRDSAMPAMNLICSNDLPYVCKQIEPLLKNHAHVGRPTLYRLLHHQGYTFSDGQIHNAMVLRRKMQIRSLLNEM